MESEKINYNAFADDFKEDTEEKGNLKISNSNSRFKKEKSEGHSKQEFDERVSDYKENESNIINKVSDLSIKFKTCLLDKTLPDNKGPAKKDMEKQVIKQLVDLGLQLNNDQNKPEGIGSIGLVNLIMQLMLEQRNRINELEHKLHYFMKRKDEDD